MSRPVLVLLCLACAAAPAQAPPPPEPLDVPRVIGLCQEQYGKHAQWSVSDVGGVTLFRCGLQKVETVCVDTGSLRPSKRKLPKAVVSAARIPSKEAGR